MADVAGLHYSTSPEGHSGVELRVDGFSHRLPALVLKLLATAAGCRVRAESFGRVHEALMRRYKNANMSVGKAASYARLYALQVRFGLNFCVLGRVGGRRVPLLSRPAWRASQPPFPLPSLSSCPPLLDTDRRTCGTSTRSAQRCAK